MFIYYHIIQNFSSLLNRHRKGDRKRRNQVTTPSFALRSLFVIFSPQGIRFRTSTLPELDRLQKMENVLYLS